MKIKIQIVIILLSFLIVTSGNILAGSTQCTEEMAIEAEEAVDHLSDWGILYKTYKLYGHCDDGAIAEGFSDGVAKLLANKWDKIDELRILINEDRLFEDFVIRHIDATITSEDNNKIVFNSKNYCPNDLICLCKRIMVKAIEQ